MGQMNMSWGRGALICGPSGEETGLGKKVSGSGLWQARDLQHQGATHRESDRLQQGAASPQGTGETSRGQERTRQRLLRQNVFTHSLEGKD